MLGSVPIVYAGHVKELHDKHNVRVVLNLMDEYEGPIKEYEKFNMTQVYLPTVDHFEPTLETLVAAMRVLSDCKKKSIVAYVHCKGGHGRSAAVAAAWLLTNSLTPSQAQDHLNSIGHVRRKLLKQPNLVRYYNLCSDENNKDNYFEGDETTPLVSH